MRRLRQHWGMIEQLEPRHLLQITPVVAEQLAREIAYRDWAIGAQVTFEGTNAQPVNLPYTVDAKWHHATGFDAYGLTSVDNGPVLVLRGSEFFPENFKYKDLLSDADRKGIGYEQFLANWNPNLNPVRAWLKARNASVDFVGHSLGGALAQWFAAAWSNANDAGPGAGGKPVDQVYTFCSSGISDNRQLKLITYASDPTTNPPGFDDTKANGVTHYIALGDIVSMAGEKFIKGNVVTYSWKSNLQLKHIEPFLNAGVRPLPAPSGVITQPNPAPTAGNLTIDALNAAGYVHNDADYRTFVAAVAVTANGLAAKDPRLARLRLVPALFMSRKDVEASRKVLGEMLTKATGNLDITIENDVYKVTFGDQTGPLYKGMVLHLDSIQVTVDNSGAQPTVVATGKMRVVLPVPTAFNLPIPALLGGAILGVNHYIEVPVLDANARIDKDKLEINGNTTVLKSLASVNGKVTFDWSKNHVVVSGTSTFLGGFVTADGSMTISPLFGMTGSGNATVNCPPGIPLVGGKPLANGAFDFAYVNGNLGASYLEGVGAFQPIFFGPVFRAGARVTMNGGLTVIMGSRRIRIFDSPSEGSGSSAVGGFDIPSNQQWLVMQAAWQNPSASTQIRVISPSLQVYDEAQIAAHPDMELVSGLNDSFSRTVMVQNPAAGIWQIELVDVTGLGTHDFVAYVDLPPVGAVFGSISGGGRRQDVNIHLDVTDPLGTASVSLYYDRDATGEDGELIAADLTPTNGAIDHVWNVTDIPAGPVHLYAVLTPDDIPVEAIYAPSPVLITEVRPTVVAQTFLFEDFHAVQIEFDQNVSTSLALSDLTLSNLTTGLPIPSGHLSLQFDSYLNTATLRAPGASGELLLDGLYRLTAPAVSITNSDGETLASDVTFDFFFLNGDANRDQRVNLLDFNILALNFARLGATFSQGNFDYDTTVNLSDFNILATKFGKALGPPSARPGGLFPFASDTTALSDADVDEVLI